MSTPRLKLPEIEEGQEKKYITHNEALFLLDATALPVCIDRDRSSPPSSSEDGDVHIVGYESWEIVSTDTVADEITVDGDATAIDADDIIFVPSEGELTVVSVTLSGGDTIIEVAESLDADLTGEDVLWSDGDWNGETSSIALYTLNNGWRFLGPPDGARIYVLNEGLDVQYQGSSMRWEVRQYAATLPRTSTETIATGSIDKGNSTQVTLSPESGTEDTLNTINGGSTGEILILLAEADDVITLGDTGNIKLSGYRTQTVTASRPLALFYDGSNWRDLRDSGLLDPAFHQDPTTLDISSGVVTKAQNYHRVAPETDDTDILNTIEGSNGMGDVVLLAPSSGTSEITLSHAGGNIYLSGESDLTLSHPQHHVLLVWNGTWWCDIAGGGGGGGGGSGSVSADPDTLALRDGNGRTKMAEPSESDDVARLAEINYPDSVQLTLDSTRVPRGYFISNITLDDTTDLSTNVSWNRGMATGNDGTKFYVVDETFSNLVEYTLSTPWDLSSFTHQNNFSLGYAGRGLALKPDGTRFFVAKDAAVEQYDASTAFDTTTLSSSGTLDVSGQGFSVVGLAMKDDGTKLFLIQSGSYNQVLEYTLGTEWDVTTASFNQSFDISGNLTDAAGLAFKADGTAFYSLDQGGNLLLEWTLSTVWDISTAVFEQSVDYSGITTNVYSLTFGNEGRILYLGAYDSTATPQTDVVKADPDDPAEGKGVLYVAPTGSQVGDEGDLCIKVTNSAGTTKSGILFDFSAN